MMLRLTDIGPQTAGMDEFHRYRCACGKEIVRRRRYVDRGQIKSCGCLNTEMRRARNHKHGMAARDGKIPEYHVWQTMIGRCHRPKSRGYELYGGRGIVVCDRWRSSFADFISDMGRRPSPLYSIDRINNDGNYEPGNCRWSTAKEQCENRRPRRWFKRPSDG